MYSDSIILRAVIQAGLTTKGSELTAAELDGNFIALWQDLKERLSAGALTEYDSGTTYTDGDAVSFDGFTWIYIFATPTSGTTPGSDEDVWIKIPVEFLAHQKDRDEALAKGTLDEVSAAEIRAFIDGGGPSANWFNTDLTADANHTHDAAGFGSAVNNLSHWWLDASDFAPTGGRASHERWGYGSGSSDVIDRVRNGAGVLIHEMYGDATQKAYGSILMNANVPIYLGDSGQSIAKSTSANAIALSANGGVWNIGWNGPEIRGVGAFGDDAIDIYNSSVNSYVTQRDGDYLWGFGKKGHNGSIKGHIGGGFAPTEIVSIIQSTGKWIFSQGLLNINGIPTSAAGLSAGDVWSDSGTLKIV